MSRSRILSAGLATMALAIAAMPAHSAVMSPFRAMAGSWSGGGTLSMANGEQERLRCRAAYNVGGRADLLSLNLRCASQSYNFDLAGNVAYRDGAISGQWTEASRNAAGTISGRADGDHVEAAAQGQNFSANLSLTTRGNRQTVSIRPEGSDVRAVSLALERR
jgi:hypothetical protein